MLYQTCMTYFLLWNIKDKKKNYIVLGSEKKVKQVYTTGVNYNKTVFG